MVGTVVLDVTLAWADDGRTWTHAFTLLTYILPLISSSLFGCNLTNILKARVFQIYGFLTKDNIMKMKHFKQFVDSETSTCIALKGFRYWDSKNTNGVKTVDYHSK